MTTTEARRAAAAALLALAGSAHGGEPVELDALTSPELRDRIAAGDTTVLLPIGGTEQSGAHLALGKHNARVRVLAQKIAQGLGHTLVAPVLAYVPEGSIEPPAAHMRYAGTVSIPEAAFEAVLESAAKSLCHHGFRDVVLLGDHGGYQRNLERVADRLERARPRSKQPACRTHALLDYYQVTQGAYVEALRARGFGTDEIGTHAGLADTALTLATEPALVRTDRLGRAPKPGERDGVQGDPRRATLALGQVGVDLIVDTSVKAIRQRLAQPR
ncbi:creatininase family protein [Ideonella sp.]|uniref:creatininase family protein n=1 Tax=Ideonella sp. TaxID=1929293 RepID=UPI002B49E94F|nr:creatininase family protein [Ideonella sp.]HJV67510.1 creatininase family protein [Ideonella sp.]